MITPELFILLWTTVTFIVGFSQVIAGFADQSFERLFFGILGIVAGILCLIL
jgi:hypothetical protein